MYVYSSLCYTFTNLSEGDSLYPHTNVIHDYHTI